MNSDVEPYVQSQYSRADYKLLDKEGTRFLRARLRNADYRDKRIRRGLTREESKVFHGPFEDVPLYLNDIDPEVVAIAKWRLIIAK